MDDKLALEILSELPQSNFWEAFTFYNQKKDMDALNALGSLDAFKEPTAMARWQGVRLGIFYLQKDIQSLLSEKEKKAELSQEDDENYVREE